MEISFLTLCTKGNVEAEANGKYVYLGKSRLYPSLIQCCCEDEAEARGLADAINSFYEERREAAKPDDAFDRILAEIRP